MKKAGLAVLILAIGLGIFSRFMVLQGRPFGEDEYYSVAAIRSILKTGIPQFYGGGYYFRSWPLHYVQAGMARVLGDEEWVYRLPAAVFGVLSLPLFFLYARKFVPPSLALVAVALLGISAWHLEFSRLLRMYTLFQCVTIAFFYAYHEAFFARKAGWRFAPFVICAVAVVIHGEGLLLLPFLFVPLILPAGPGQPKLSREKLSLGAAAVLTSALTLLYNRVENEAFTWGVTNRLPETLVVQRPPPASAALPVLSPEMDAKLMLLLAGCALALIGIGLIFRSPRLNSENFIVSAGSMFIVISSIFHRFTLAGIALALLLLRYDLVRHVRERRHILALLAFSAATAAGWGAYAFADRGWAEVVAPGDFFKGVRLAFFGWPDIYEPTLDLFRDTMPKWTMVITLAAVWHLLRLRKAPIGKIARHPVVAPMYLAIVLGVIYKPGFLITTRYTFFIYPLMILLVVMAAYEVALVISRSRRGREYAMFGAGALPVLAFIWAEDFHPAVVLTPTKPEVTYRAGEFRRFAKHWYYRKDEASPARFIETHQAKQDLTIVSLDCRTLPFYLNSSNSFAYFHTMNTPGFIRSSRNRGKTDAWTGQRLVGSEADLRELTARAQTMLLTRITNQVLPGFDLQRAWEGRNPSFERVFLSRDRRIEVLQVRLSEPLFTTNTPLAYSPSPSVNDR